MTIGKKIGGSFLLLSLLILTCGLTGYYGIYRLSHSLDFITQTAWDAADGAMEAVIGIKGQMIALERILSKTEIIDTTEETRLHNLIEEGKAMMIPALERMKNSGLMSKEETAQLNKELPTFLDNQEQALAAHKDYQIAHIHLDTHHAHFFAFLKSVETVIHSATNTLEDQLDTLALKRSAIDSLREAQKALLERSYYFEALTISDDETELAQMKTAQIYLEKEVNRLVQHPYLKTTVDVESGKTYQALLTTFVEQHIQDFSKTLKHLRHFKTAGRNYTQTANTLLQILENIENVGDSKVEDESNTIAKAKYVAKITIIIVVITAFGLAIIASFYIVRSITLPLSQMKEHLSILAQGQLPEKHLVYRGNDEIADIVMSACQLRGSMKNIIEQANAIAAGDYSNDIKLLSETDQLGRALRDMTVTLRGVIEQANAIAMGDYGREVTILSNRDQLGQALFEMTCKLRDMTAENNKQDWLKTGQAELNEKMRGEQDMVNLAKQVITFLANYLNAEVGLFYALQAGEPAYLQMIAGYAYTQNDKIPTQFLIGEGLVGQAALEKKIFLRTQQWEENAQIAQSGLSVVMPHHILLLPFLYENKVIGVIELGAATAFTDLHREFLEQIMPSIGIAANTALSRSKMQTLLQQTQAQTEQLKVQTTELQTQQERMQQANEELKTQAEELQSQQEELRQTNDELETRTRELEKQKDSIREKNLALEKTQADMEKAKQAIEIKAEELELASKYKSEFLANMSHELRTPLNSLLILAQLLTENKAGNLTEKQQEYARTIHSAGSDLLTLINDILDLSKVEAGKIEVQPEDISFKELMETIESKFRHVAEEKQIGFHITVSEAVPAIIHTDIQRLKQIINNLLSNAFKFTSQGEINLIVEQPTEELTAANLCSTKVIALRVSDTGIGIPEDKQKLIFEAFQQADGTTNRRYGGTGLGLSISRQLARLLGGELTLRSQAGQGSCFTLYIPEVLSVSPKVASNTLFNQVSSEPIVEIESHVEKIIIDDRKQLNPGDKYILIVEDDRKFSKILTELAHEKGFKCLLAEDGKTGLQLAETYRPHAIILDLNLPKIDGWTVMEKLKDNPAIRHIPVHFMSAIDQSLDARKMGAIGYLLKPINMEQLGNAFKKIEGFIDRRVKNLLVVADDKKHQQKILDLVANDEVQITCLTDCDTTYQRLQTTSFDCVVLDIEVEVNNGIYLLEKLCQKENLSQSPIIVYAERALTIEEENYLQQCTTTLAVKTAQSPERLLDEATLFLHQIEKDLPQEKRHMLKMMHDKTAILTGKKVLVVDDDVRNTFALTTILEDKDMEVIVGKHGKEALASLQEHPDVDIVLMDIMMPEMDGYEAIKIIRAQECFHKLPIIALTAKAMKGDKNKCISAGANDYLSKPIDTDKLISLMRVWLYR